MVQQDEQAFKCPTEKKTLHFNLSHIGDHDDLRVHANLREYQLKKHDEASLQHAIQKMPFLQLLPKEHVTHYVEDLPVPAERPSLITASIPREMNGQPVRHMVAMHIHIPQKSIVATKADRQAILEGCDVHPRFARYGLSPEDFDKVKSDPLDPQNGFNDPSDTAAALMFHHNCLTHVNPDVAANVLGICGKYTTDIAGTISMMGADWVKQQPVKDFGGNQMHGDKGQPLYTYKLNSNVAQSTKGPVLQAIRDSRDTESLRNHLWSVQEGKGASTYNAVAAGGFVARSNAGNPWQRKYTSGEHGLDIGNVRSSGNTVQIDVTNYWNRHLGIYVQFLDNTGAPIVPSGWTDNLPDSPENAIQQLFEPNPTKKYVDYVQPIGEVMGIPLPAEATTLSFPVPDAANGFMVYAGGVGLGTFDKDVCLPGILFTAFFEFAIPMTLMVAGAALATASDFTSILKDHEVMEKLLNFFLTAVGAAAGNIENFFNGDVKGIFEQLAQDLGPMLLEPVIAKVVAKYVAATAAEDAIPFVDIAFAILDVAVDVSAMAQTTAEVLSSPFAYKSEFTRTVDLNVTINHDQNAPGFPPQATHYKVWCVYDTKATVAAQEFSVSQNSGPCHVSFPGIPSGGKLQVFTAFYAADDWVAGQGQTDWIDTVNAGNAIAVSITIKQNLVPLTSNTVYSHYEKLTYGGGTYQWLETKTPPTTVPNNQGSIPNGTGITLAQMPECIGYAWQSPGGGSYCAQSMSLTREPNRAYAQSSGHNSKVGICYDFASGASNGKNYFIDESGQVRQIVITPAGCQGIPSGDSYGSFPFAMADYVIHPQGYIFGISSGNMSKIFRCELALGAKCTLLSGKGNREGLIDNPVAIAVGLDGVLLVLEAGNNRVQAFDVCGNPIRYFNGNYWFALPPGATYLDMAVEPKGYIYVLSYQGSGGSPSDYQMTVYKPDGTLLITTSNVAAGKLTVDMWRSVYTLNYEQIQDRDEPSVSEWIPSAP